MRPYSFEYGSDSGWRVNVHEIHEGIVFQDSNISVPVKKFAEADFLILEVYSAERQMLRAPKS